MKVTVVVVLLAVCLVGMSRANLACGNVACLPGIENLGRGFDAVYGRLTGGDVVDLVPASSGSTWTNPYTGDLYGVPDSVEVSNTPYFDIHSLSFRSSAAFAASHASDWGLTVGYGWTDGMFSLNADVQSVEAELYRQDTVVNLAREVQEVYAAQIDPLRGAELTEEFVAAVEALPGTYDEQSYQAIIDSYGTHVVRWGVFGGRATMLGLVDTAYSAEYSDQTLSFNAKLEFLALKGSLEVAYNKNGPTVSFSANLRDYNLTFEGGDTAIGASNYTAWVNSVRFAPALVQAQLLNITDFVHDTTKRKNLQQQIDLYYYSHPMVDTTVPKPPFKLNWFDPVTMPVEQACSVEPFRVVIGGPLHDDYSNMPWDCASLSISWLQAAAFTVHDWTQTSEVAAPAKVRSFRELDPSKIVASADTCMVGSFQCGSGTCLPGLDAMGIGMNIATGEQQVVPLLNFTYAQNKLWVHPVTGTAYVTPDQTTVFDDVTDSVSTTVIHSEQELRDYYAGRFGLGVGIPGVFSLSFGVQSSTTVFYGAQALLAITEEDMSFYDITVSDLQPSQYLIDAVAKLPAAYDEVAYASFVEIFGTHFIQQGFFGGRSVMRVAVDQSYYSNNADSDISFQASVQFGGFKLGGYLDASQNTQDYQQFDGSSFAEFQVVGGQYLEYTMQPGMWAKWQESLYCNPGVVRQNVSPLADLVDMIDSVKGGNVRTYVTAYLNQVAAQTSSRNPVLPSSASVVYNSPAYGPDSYAACPSGQLLLGTEYYNKKSGNYYNLAPSLCAVMDWDADTASTGLVDSVFLDGCVAEDALASKHYSGCAPDSFAYGYSSYKDAKGGVVGKTPILCCNAFYYGNDM